jgi:WD40 repeat protein
MPGGQARAALTGHPQPVFALAFSRDGRTLATGSGDRTARLWDVGSGHTRATLVGNTDGVSSVVFSADGRTLATGGWDGAVRLWDAALPTFAAAIDKICRAVHRDLTTQERSVYLPATSEGTAVCP